MGDTWHAFCVRIRYIMMTTAPIAPASHTSPREIAAYLVALRPILLKASAAQQGTIDRFTQLTGATRTGTPVAVATLAGKIGRDHLEAFRLARAGARGLAPPRECSYCHRTFAAWLDRLIRACEILVDIGQIGGIARMREVQAYISDSRSYAQAFNDEYAQQVQRLRHRMAANVRRARTSADPAMSGGRTPSARLAPARSRVASRR